MYHQESHMLLTHSTFPFNLCSIILAVCGNISSIMVAQHHGT